MVVLEAGGAGQVPAVRGPVHASDTQHAALALMRAYLRPGAVCLPVELRVPRDIQCHIAYPFGHLLLAQEVEDFRQAVQDGRIVFHRFYRLFEPQK